MKKSSPRCNRFRQSAFALLAVLALARVSTAEDTKVDPNFVEPVAPGPFQPSWESLGQYKVPDWYRDAKFGIWAHWSAQCVPEEGDWYARNMYEEGSPDYKFQVAHYGHPSKVGFKDIDNLWHAQNWDPEKLIALYKRAGAQYFVALANHHDNFDTWDSKYQPWNSVNIGPHKNIIAGWEKAARAAGLRFGVTVHAAHAWSWLEVAQGSDKHGALAGVPYDGKLTKADGKGTWWEGYDPQDLYAQNHVPGKKLVWDWQADQGSSIPDQAYCEKFYNRTIDLINKYHPDLMYFDDSILPLNNVSDAGLKIAAHYYNTSANQNDGHPQVVMTTKGLTDQQRKSVTLDIERGITAQLDPLPWQTDTCIGDWHYNRYLYTQHKYKTVDQVVHMLADVVSKNGNLLLNIPVRGDGSIDPDEVKFLEALAPWMATNGEAIFRTRPWVVYGEGAAQIKPGAFQEGGANFTSKDIRFTARGDTTLYAMVMAWPSDGKVLIHILAKNPGFTGQITDVQLLGHTGSLQFSQDEKGLAVTFPAEKPGNYVFPLKITGSKLTDFKETAD